MTKTTVYKVIAVQGATLMVFYTENQSWQFRLISAGGVVCGEHQLYCSSVLAEQDARQRLSQWG